jgi:DNA repair protein RadA/Sms
MLLAVLEKRLALSISFSDAYLNIAGGIKASEPAVDLAVAVALWSSFRDKPLAKDAIVLGEVGLTGEVRGVQQIERRLNEAQKLGFAKAIIPLRQKETKVYGIDLIGVRHVAEACELLSV